MSMFTIIPSDIRDQIQKNAGVLLSAFDPTNPYTPPNNADIIGATTGGINPVCTPTMQDFFEDVDNAPNNTKEGQEITGYTCTMGFTSISFNEDNIKRGIGATTVTVMANGVKKIVPRKDIEMTDFKDIWWVTDMLNGGALAIKLKNAFSTDGLSIQSTKDSKGTAGITLTGFVSATAQSDMPMEYYLIPPQGGEISGAIELNHHTVTLPDGESVTLVATTYPADAVVTWDSGSDAVATVTSGGVVTAEGEGDTIITAQITVDSVEFTDTCTIVVPASED